MTQFHLIDEDDPFFKSPKEANSRAECPYEIGSDQWLEWQRDFAWQEYSKPSGQERIEAAYQRLKKNGFQIVRQLPQGTIPRRLGGITTLFVTKEYAYFTEQLDTTNLYNGRIYSLPRLQSRTRLNHKWDRVVQADDLRIYRDDYYIYQLYSLEALVAIDVTIKISIGLIEQDAAKFLQGEISGRRMYETIQRYKE